MIYQAEFEHIRGISIALFFCLSILSVYHTQWKNGSTRPTHNLVFLRASSRNISMYRSRFFTDQLHLEAFQLKGWDLLWILILGLLCTAYAFNVSIQVMRHLSSFTIMMVINLEPIYGILLSLAIWNEKAYLSINFYLGFLVVLSAILMNGLYKHRKEAQKKTSQL